ncbi:lytic transglycosylase domain-containing protein [Saccharibacter sp. 17.LH.SD]|uniref:lytic transglycosylase domain-containing protein n=1 Tax=Saccharibacter sp. 17.LH.SD TaxID=2689393 RepID=UPI001927977F|nr:lytic transglycosylase domain-containing protein [Saccharibacter sp. 17.LH.SD]
MPESIWTIGVEDEEFQNYLNSVRDYNELLKESAALLQSATTLTSGKDDGQQRVSTQSRLLVITQQLNAANDKGNLSERERNRLLREQELLLRKNSTHQNDMIGQAKNFARSPVGKATLLGGISGIGKGLMSMLNLAHRLTQSGSDIRTNARITGVTPGQLLAWQSTFKSYGGFNNTLALASQSLTDPEARGKLLNLGVRGETINRGNVTEIGREALAREAELSQKYGKNLTPVLNGMQLGNLAEDAANFPRLQAQERSTLLESEKRNETRLKLPDSTLKTFNDAQRTSDVWQATRQKDLFLATEKTIGTMSQVSNEAAGKLDDAATKLMQVANQLGPGGMLAVGGAALLAPTLISLIPVALGAVFAGGTVTAVIGGVLAALGVGAAAYAAYKSGLFSKLWSFFTGDDDPPSKKDDQPGKEQKQLNAHYQDSTGSWSTDDMKKLHECLCPPRPPTCCCSSSKASHADQKQQNNATNGGGGNSPSPTTLTQTRYDAPPPPSLTGSEQNDNGQGQQENISDDLLAGAVAMQESGGNSNAIGPMTRYGRAKGLMQLIDATARAHGVTNPFDAWQSWNAGMAELKSLRKHYHGDLEKTEAAYNWGRGNLDDDIRRNGDHWRDYLHKETRDYIAHVTNNIRTHHVVRIDNRTGMSVSVSSRQNSTGAVA